MASVKAVLGTETNHFPAPSFELGSGVVEVRRNRFTDPRFTNMANWSIVNGTTSVSDGVLSITMTASTPSNFVTPAVSFVNVGTAGQAVSAAYEVENRSAVSRGFRVNFYDGVRYLNQSDPYVTIPPGGKKRVTASATRLADSTYMQPRLHTQGVESGDVILVSEPIVEVSPVIGRYFNGSTRPKLRRNRVKNTLSGGSISGLSFARGTLSEGDGYVRLTITDAMATTGAQRISYEGDSRIPVNTAATFRFDAEARTSSTADMQASVGFYDAGGTPLTRFFGPVVPASTTFQPLHVEVPQGDIPASAVTASVWIGLGGSATGVRVVGDTLDARAATDAGLPFFDGSTTPDPGFATAWEGTPGTSASYIYDSDLSVSWTGTANGSESILTGVPVAGVAASGCAAIRSTRWKKSGDYSMRLIPTRSSTNVNYVLLNVPAAAMSGGTAVVTYHQEGPITGAAWAQRGRPYTVTPMTQPDQAVPNVAGDTDIRWQWGALTNSGLVLPHGGLEGSGDLWIDDLLLVEGGPYTGPYFDGNTAPIAQGNGIQYGFAWSGAANNSASVRTRFVSMDTTPGQPAVFGTHQLYRARFYGDTIKLGIRNGDNSSAPWEVLTDPATLSNLLELIRPEYEWAERRPSPTGLAYTARQGAPYRSLQMSPEALRVAGVGLGNIGFDLSFYSQKDLVLMAEYLKMMVANPALFDELPLVDADFYDVFQKADYGRAYL